EGCRDHPPAIENVRFRTGGSDVHDNISCYRAHTSKSFIPVFVAMTGKSELLVLHVEAVSPVPGSRCIGQSLRTATRRGPIASASAERNRPDGHCSTFQPAP